MMKYKELRILSLVSIVVIGIMIKLIVAISQHEKNMIIACALILFSALWITIGRYNNKVEDDFVLVYEYKIIGIMPTVIDIKDIKSVECSKHIVTIQHLKKTKVYMLDAISFKNKIEEKINHL